VDTAIVSTSWLEPNPYFLRTLKWLRHLRELGLDGDILFLDNGSSAERIADFRRRAGGLDFDVLAFPETYRRLSLTDYLYEWRVLYAFRGLFDQAGVDRVIWIANDFFIRSQRLCDWLAAEARGWSALWCPRYAFPESGLQVIVRGCPQFDDFVRDGDFACRNGELMEHVLPFTHVERAFVGDRYRETRDDPPPPHPIDFIAQLRLEDPIPPFSGAAAR
jgi:hypothetical protein